MSAPCRRAASFEPENHGKRRENGTERTSAMAVTPASCTSVMKRSAGRLEWPMVNSWKSACSATASTTSSSDIHLQGGDERLLRDVDLAELAHALLAFLLLAQKLALARDVAAIAFGGDVLAEGAHGLARDHLAADRGLDPNVEHGRRESLLW